MKRLIKTNDGRVLDLPRVLAQEWIDAGSAKWHTPDAEPEKAIEASQAEIPIPASPLSDATAPKKAAAPKKTKSD